MELSNFQDQGSKTTEESWTQDQPEIDLYFDCVADGEFQLTGNIMEPNSQKVLDELQRLYSYKLSRMRRIS